MVVWTSTFALVWLILVSQLWTLTRGRPSDYFENKEECHKYVNDYLLADIFGCCGNKRYSLLTQRCCSQLLPSRKVHRRHINLCCDWNVVDRSKFDSCCGSQGFHSADQLCCGGAIVNKTKFDSCCGFQGFNSSAQMCCNGVPQDRKNFDSCCDKQGYTADVSLCCNGIVQDKADFDSCCASRGYNSNVRFCCNRPLKDWDRLGPCTDRYIRNPSGCAVYLKKTGWGEYTPSYLYEKRKYDSCCDLQGYNSSASLCCEGALQDKRKYNSCCGRQGYDSNSHLCCAGVLYVKEKFSKCCGTWKYNSAVSQCSVPGKVEKRNQSLITAEDVFTTVRHLLEVMTSR